MCIDRHVRLDCISAEDVLYLFNVNISVSFILINSLMLVKIK